ncbi:MAG: glycosyltransferase family 39 protein [Inquilinus limosus]|uniref:Glycosyltransferase family 39 protein n=1 Tax=Inquilinus limosus TaxID=171674 RepID=A0A952FMS4_9PROT|nr:glycosyltransferase family 39 protein [Inquilinus limosus]
MTDALSAASARPGSPGSAGWLRLDTPQGAIFWLILLGGLLRLALAWALGYGNGESYYVATARFFALSYFDQPPLFLWLTHAMIGLSDAELWLRLPYVLMFGVSTWLMYRLGGYLFGAWAGVWAALLLNLSAVFFLSVGSWVQPDGPLFLFLLAAAYCTARVVVPEPETLSRGAAWGWWLAAGVCFGLALLSKYHAVLMMAGLLLFLLTTRGRRRWLAHPAPWIAVVIAFAIFSPVLIWNAENQWVSFLFQSGRSSGGRIRFDWLGQNIGGQAIWLLPWVWLPMIWVFIAGLLRGPKDLRGWYLVSLAVIPILLFTAVASWARIGAHFHWQAPGYLLLFPLLGAATARWLEAGSRTARIWLKASGIATVAVLVILGSHAATGWMRALPGLGPTEIWDPTLEGLDWTDLRAAAEERGWYKQPGLFVVGTQWHQTGKIDVQLGDRLPVLCLCRDPRNLAFGWNQMEFAGHDAVIIGQDEFLKDFDERWRPYFASVEPQPDIIVHRGGRAELTLHVFTARGFKAPWPLPLPPGAPWLAGQGSAS